MFERFNAILSEIKRDAYVLNQLTTLKSRKEQELTELLKQRKLMSESSFTQQIKVLQGDIEVLDAAIIPR